MAQKAAKQQAARNTAILKNVHLFSLGVNGLFIFLRFLLFRSSCTRATYLLYFMLCAPAFGIQFWFEKIGRPVQGSNGELRKPGDDLEANGVTEYMFDVLYWSWGTIIVASFVGDKGWWMWLVIPLYSVYLGYTTFAGVRQGMTGMAGQGPEGAGGSAATSNRQKKLEKRGGPKVQYR